MNALAPPPALEAAAVSAALHARLRAILPRDVYDSWFPRLELAAIVDGEARLTLPTKFLVAWVRDRYEEPMREALALVAPSIAGFTLALRQQSLPARIEPASRIPPSGSPPPPPAPVVIQPAPVPEAPRGSPLDPRLTFATFRVGASNRLAHAAATGLAAAVAESAAPAFNPLVIHGAVGLGKTHLAQAIVASAQAGGRRALYLTAERLLYNFAVEMKGLSSWALRERLRDIDLVVLDDAQFLHGRGVRVEVAALVDALTGADGSGARTPLVVAADRPVHELEGLDERVRSRLAGGLAVEVGALDSALRTQLLAARVAAVTAARPGFAVSDEVVAHVAGAVRGNGRDLDGAVNRLLAHASLIQAPLTVDDAACAIRDLVREAVPRRVRIEDIQKLCATHYGIRRDDILSARRSANVVRPRQIAMYLAKVLTLRSLPEIGRRFGGRDHTTVIHAVRKIEGLAAADRALGEEVALLRRMLEEA